MQKKIIALTLVFLFLLPMTCQASFADDVEQFKQKYSSIYQSIDPALAVKMDSFLEEVVQTIVDNYDPDISMNEQINYVVTLVLTDDPDYNQDLLPFLMDQMENNSGQYSGMISEMKEIVRKEVENRLNPPHEDEDQTNPCDQEIEHQLSEGANPVRLDLVDYLDGLVITGSALQDILDAGKTLEVSAQGITIKLNKYFKELPSDALFTVSVDQLSAASKEMLTRNLSDDIITGPVFDIKIKRQSNSDTLTFNSPITVVMPYIASDFDNADEDTLDVYYYNEDTLEWVEMDGTVDSDEHTISFQTTHFSRYAVMAEDNNGNGNSTHPTTPGQSNPPTGNQGNTKVKFTDINGHWAQSIIEKMAGLGLVSGMSDTQFAPQRTVTRAEFATLLVKVLNIPQSAQLMGRFYDVPKDKWYFTTVNTAASAGIISGYSNTRFGPDDPVTREQMAVMITKALAYKGKNLPAPGTSLLSSFRDNAAISSWARSGVSLTVQLGLMKGRGNSEFAPGAYATRAEATVLIYQMGQYLKIIQ